MAKIEGKFFKADTVEKQTVRVGKSAYRFFIPIERIDGRGTVCHIEVSADEKPTRIDERVEKLIACLDGGFSLWRAPEPVTVPAGGDEGDRR
jgi:hypothetical protein